MPDTYFEQEGTLLDYTPAVDTEAGAIVFLGTECGQVVATVSANEKGARRVEGVIKVTKQPADVFDIATRADVHWDATNLRAATAAADGLMGKAVGGGANGQDYVMVKLNWSI